RRQPGLDPEWTGLAELGDAGRRSLSGAAPIASRPPHWHTWTTRRRASAWLPTRWNTDERLARRHHLEQRRPGTGNRPGSQDRPCADDGLDEPRGPGPDRCRATRHLLVALARQTVAQGRGIRSCAETA